MNGFKPNYSSAGSVSLSTAQPLPNYSYSYLGSTNIQVGLNLIYLISVFAGCYMNNEIERVKWTTFQLKYDPVNVSSSTPLNFLQQSSRLSHVM